MPLKFVISKGITTTVVVLNVGISRCFIKICPISISQKMLYRYNENPRICDVVTSNIFHYINFWFQDFCRYNEMLLYSSVVISRLTCIKCYTVKVSITPRSCAVAEYNTVRCNCKSNCVSRMCACFKARVQCHSNCHPHRNKCARTWLFY